MPITSTTNALATITNITDLSNINITNLITETTAITSWSDPALWSAIAAILSVGIITYQAILSRSSIKHMESQNKISADSVIEMKRQYEEEIKNKYKSEDINIYLNYITPYFMKMEELKTTEDACFSLDFIKYYNEYLSNIFQLVKTLHFIKDTNFIYQYFELRRQVLSEYIHSICIHKKVIVDSKNSRIFKRKFSYLIFQADTTCILHILENINLFYTNKISLYNNSLYLLGTEDSEELLNILHTDLQYQNQLNNTNS